MLVCGYCGLEIKPKNGLEQEQLEVKRLMAEHQFYQHREKWLDSCPIPKNAYQDRTNFIKWFTSDEIKEVINNGS